MEVVPKEPEEKIDRQYVLERKIIELLLLYGAHKETFEDLIIQENENGELEEKQVSLDLFVYEKSIWNCNRTRLSLLTRNSRRSMKNNGRSYPRPGRVQSR